MRLLIALVLFGALGLEGAKSPTPDNYTNYAALAKTSLHAKEHANVHLWRISLVSLTAANAFDVASSWNKRELNGLLRNSDGTMAFRGAAIKLSLLGGLAVVEYLVVRHDPQGSRHRVATWFNFAAAAAITAVASHNLTIPGK